MRPNWRLHGLLILLVGLNAGCSRPAQSKVAPRTPAKATSTAGKAKVEPKVEAKVERKVEAKVERKAEAAPASQSTKSKAEPRTVVVWISIDGMRGDYVDTVETRFCRRLMKEGAFTKKLVPVFPSLTFPSHVSQATGASVNRHGIIANAIYDDVKDTRWSYPNVAKEVLCEPIWNTVKRGGKRVLVYDWPVSQQQKGKFKADYFDQAFQGGISDAERLDRLIETWKNDTGDAPLELLMGYVSGEDKAGHKYGPNAPQTKAAVAETDALLGDFFQRCQEVFKEKMAADDTLYFILSTDHGMDDVRVILNPELLCGSAWNDEMRVVASGNVAHIFLERLGPPPARKPLVEKLKKILNTYDFVKAYARDDLPKEWEYNHPTRTGDVVAVVDTGYFFSEKPGPSMSRIDPAQGPLGMHGYPAAENPHMLGFMGIWRSGKPIGGVDLGEVDSRRLHATVARLLGVKPAETAVPDPIKLP